MWNMKIKKNSQHACKLKYRNKPTKKYVHQVLSFMFYDRSVLFNFKVIITIFEFLTSK